MAIDIATRISHTIAAEIGARPDQVGAAIALLDGGSTVPFVARYRKEVTGGLDDGQLRTLAERLDYLRDLEARRATILDTVRSQGNLTEELASRIAAAESKAVLEDLYLPFKPKRRTRAAIAREKGLAPLAEAILVERQASPDSLAAAYINDDVPDVKEALAGARDILVERLAENADLVGQLRTFMQKAAFITAQVVKGKEEAGAKFSDYFGHTERWATVPSHRALAMMRASNEGVVTINIAPDADGQEAAIGMVAGALQIRGSSAGDVWLKEVARWAWRTKLSLSMMLDLMGQLRTRAHEEAIRVFARNLKDLLLAAPAGAHATMGLDPGVRTGVKVAVVDATGKLLETATVYPFQPKNDLRGAQSTLASLIRKHKVALIAIGNGTASRETERLVAEMIALLPSPKPTRVVVSEAGASVYSASELAAKEFPGLDVSLRGAVSIARRLQDPLAELVKIEPKAIGVGQYQHDVDQHRLERSLEAVVEDAVNAVGVDLNMASAALLSHVSGLGPALAEAIVAHRDANGPFRTRKDLLTVPRLGQRTFVQCAGFLRIQGGAEPLDASAVHPEAYGLARRIVAACGRDLRSIMGDEATLRGIDAQDFVDDAFGLPTVRDILAELAKPGRDPRPSFVTARFAEGVEDIKDLRPGMLLEGTVTNVAAFGAFIDIGVHQDGLVHVSQLADRFVRDPHEVLKAGDVVKVRVVDVDVARKRIGLSMRRDSSSANTKGGQPASKSSRATSVTPEKDKAAKSRPSTPGTLGAALLDAMKNK